MLDGVGVTVYIDEVRRGEEVRGELGLLVNHIVLVVSHQRAVVGVEELFSGVLCVCVWGGGGYRS